MTMMIHNKGLRLLVLFMTMIFIAFQTTTNTSAASTTFKLKEQKATIQVGSVKQLQVLTSSANKKKVQWKSNSTKIATVDKMGKVNGKAAGSATITAYIPNTKYKAAATIKVIEKVYNAKGIFNKVNPSIVYIELYNQYNEPVSSGSGVIISKDGRVATNLHVVSDFSLGQYVKIILSNGEEYETDKIIGYNEEEDLAVLKIDAPKNLPAAELGDSSKIATGDKVYALGSPLGVQNTLSEGIISNRSTKVDNVKRIQTSAPVSHGSSGGALVNQNGKVIGVVVAYLTEGQNMNLAIPVNTLKAVKTNSGMNLLELNKIIVSPHGEGDVDEAEKNDDLDTADYLPYLTNYVYGTVNNMDDMDLFGFYLKDDKTIEVTASTKDPEYSGDLGVILYDQDGNPIVTGETTFSNDDQQYITTLTRDLKPGIYYLGICAYTDSQLNWNNDLYGAIVNFK